MDFQVREKFLLLSQGTVGQLFVNLFPRSWPLICLPDSSLLTDNKALINRQLTYNKMRP